MKMFDFTQGCSVIPERDELDDYDGKWSNVVICTDGESFVSDTSYDTEGEARAAIAVIRDRLAGDNPPNLVVDGGCVKLHRDEISYFLQIPVRY